MLRGVIIIKKTSTQNGITVLSFSTVYTYYMRGNRWARVEKYIKNSRATLIFQLSATLVLITCQKRTINNMIAIFVIHEAMQHLEKHLGTCGLNGVH